MLRPRTWTLVATLAGVAVVALADGPPAGAVHTSTLQVTPELARQPTGGNQDFVATISPPSAVPQLEVMFEIVSGPNAQRGGEAKDNVADFGQPDGICLISAGQSTCTWGLTDTRSTSENTTDRVVAWIDHDNRQGDTNVSLEGLDTEEDHNAGAPPDEPAPGGFPGRITEPDSTDVVLVSWGQLGASAAPLRSGVDPGGKQCSSAVRRSGTAVVASLKRCTFVLTLPAKREEDPERNYYALWVQGDTQLRSGWCTRTLEGVLRVPAGARVLSAATTSVAGAVVTTTLVVRGGGFAFAPAAVQQTALHRSGSLTRTRSSRSASLRWRGKSPQPVALAYGVEFSLPAGVRPKTAGMGEVRLRVSSC
jgi:hypothetical protein